MDENEKHLAEQYQRKNQSSHYNRGYDADDFPAKEQNGHALQSDDRLQDIVY